MHNSKKHATCAVCQKPSANQCSHCKSRLYCSAQCQRVDWKQHRQACSKESASEWYDQYRLGRDGSTHFGKLELMTWGSEEEQTGWGNFPLDGAEAIKKRYETELGSNPEKFYDVWPRGFRWTCCGTTGSMPWGCDHHGLGEKPCTCDFCKMGTPLPDKIYYLRTAQREGLTLSRGPDPRSKSVAEGIAASVGRVMFHMDD